jgi:hypothetical protein
MREAAGPGHSLSARRQNRLAGTGLAATRAARPRQKGWFAKNPFLLSNMRTKGSNSLVLLQYSITDTTAKSLTASRHYEAHASGLLGMQRHCMSSQTFD